MEIFKPGMKGFDPRIDDTESLEKYLRLPDNCLKNIPVYARREALDAIRNVIRLESERFFRRGIYYIVLADLCKNTAFQNKYGNDLTNIRVEWFQTAVIRALGKIKLDNYVNFNKTIGDASLLIFSSFHDVVKWSNQLQITFDKVREDFKIAVTDTNNIISSYIDGEEKVDDLINEFDLKTRRLVHIGEVSYSDNTDPLALSVSQTFKAEKTFSSHEHIGCTQIVADVASPLLRGLRLRLHENKTVLLAGDAKESMTYYLIKR